MPPVIGGGHRLPPLPAPPRPGAAPVRPAAPARPDISAPPNRNAELYDKLFEGEFEAFEIPDRAQATAARVQCDASNMRYIRARSDSKIDFDYRAFYERMARYGWKAATGPSAQAQAAGVRGTVRPVGMHRDLVAVPLDRDMSRPGLGLARSTNWDLILDLKRVNAYAFRGEKRQPDVIRAAGGFQPPSMRTDSHYVAAVASNFSKYMQARFNQTIDQQQIINYIQGQGQSGRLFVEYEIWRGILRKEELHIGKMVANEFLKGFISTSRNVETAKQFFDNTSEGGWAANGAVYAVHTEGGFLLPDLAKHVHGSKKNEAEIAHPGALPWSKVMAFRPYNLKNLSDPRTYKQPNRIYMRQGFQSADPRGFRNVFNALGSLAEG